MLRPRRGTGGDWVSGLAVSGPPCKRGGRLPWCRMAVRHIARLGHPVLRQVAAPVPPADIAGPAIQALIRDLHDTVHEVEGAGLAAPQIHESLRVVVLQLLPGQPFLTWVNPVLTPLSDETAVGPEGCLSVPGLRGSVRRHLHLRVEGLDAAGEPFTLELRGFPAVVAQHECDHLDGVVYTDRVEPRTLAFLEEHRRFVAPRPPAPRPAAPAAADLETE